MQIINDRAWKMMRWVSRWDDIDDNWRLKPHVHIDCHQSGLSVVRGFPMILIYDRFGFNLCVCDKNTYMYKTKYGAVALLCQHLDLVWCQRSSLYICRWCQEIDGANFRSLPRRFSGTFESVLIYWCW